MCGRPIRSRKSRIRATSARDPPSMICTPSTSGVEAVQVIDGRVPHSVLVEIFTEAGIGTKITA